MILRKKSILTSLLAVGILLGSSVQAFAAGNTTDVKGSVGSTLTIDAKVTSVNVTVPTTAPFIFNEDGTNTVPTTFKVQNNSQIAGVYLESLSLDSKSNGWQVVNDGFDLKTMPVNTKNVRIKFGKEGKMKTVAPTLGDASATGLVSFSSGEIDIEATQEQLLKFEIERGSFSQAVSNGTAFEMTMQYKFQ